MALMLLINYILMFAKFLGIDTTPKKTSECR